MVELYSTAMKHYFHIKGLFKGQGWAFRMVKLSPYLCALCVNVVCAYTQVMCVYVRFALLSDMEK